MGHTVLTQTQPDLPLLPVFRFQSTVQVSKLQDLVNRSKTARCRGRFVCPVILFKGKVRPRRSLASLRPSRGVPGVMQSVESRVLGFCQTSLGDYWVPGAVGSRPEKQTNSDTTFFEGESN